MITFHGWLLYFPVLSPSLVFHYILLFEATVVLRLDIPFNENKNSNLMHDLRRDIKQLLDLTWYSIRFVLLVNVIFHGSDSIITFVGKTTDVGHRCNLIRSIT